MVEQIVRDKLNEVHKRSRVIQQPDYAFKMLFEKSLVDYYTFKKGLREKLKIVIDEMVADKMFKVFSCEKHSFDKNQWVEVLNKNDYIGDFDIIENKIRDLIKSNEPLWSKLEINDLNKDDTIELFLCSEVLFDASQKAD